MEKYIDIILCSDASYHAKNVNEVLVELQIKLRDDSYREQLDEELLKAIISLLITSAVSEGECGILVECLRCLRNACANCIKNQSILESSHCLDTMVKLLILCISNSQVDSDAGDKVAIARCILQIYGNCCSGNLSLQDIIWSLMTDKLSTVLMSEDEKVKDYTCMLIYNCVRNERKRLAFLLQSGSCVMRIVEHATSTHCEWGMFIIELLLALPGFLSTIHASLCSEQRLTILETLASHLQSEAHDAAGDIAANSSHNTVASDNIAYVVGEFSAALERCLPALEEASDLELHVLAAMLNALSEAASNSNYLLDLQSCDDLVVKCIALLQRLTELSKQESGPFSRVSKSRVNNVSVDASSGAFGLRALTVRLTANLCFRNKHVQDKVHKLGGLALILDQASIDDRNPFITQWTLLAIRNLCEGNEDNQQFIQQMQLQGLADPEELLRKYNLQCDVQNGKLAATRPPTSNT